MFSLAVKLMAEKSDGVPRILRSRRTNNLYIELPDGELYEGMMSVKRT